MGGFFEINPDEVSEELKSALREKYAEQLVRNKNLEPHTLEAENDLARVSNSRFLIEHGIEPTDENLEKLYQELNERIAKMQTELQKDPPQKREVPFVAKDQINVIEIGEKRELKRIKVQLSDGIWPIEDKLEKACLLLQEMLEDYFGIHNKDNEEAQKRICYDYSRYATIADMIDDYVIDAKKETRALREYIDNIRVEQP